MNLLRYRDQRVLILAPHADDETIGCGGVIQKFQKAGSPIRLLIASFAMVNEKKFKKERGSYVSYDSGQRWEETQRAYKMLGLTDYHVLFVDESAPVRYHGRLDTVPRVELVEKIEVHIQEFKPTILFIPSVTKHQDHETLHQAALTSVRPYFWNGTVVVYETDGELEFEPNLFVPLEREELAKKLDVLKTFRTQLGGERHPVSPEYLSARAKERGHVIYQDFAEAFQIIRLHG